MADIDDLAVVASQFLQSYTKVQDLSVLRQLLESAGEPESHNDAPIYQRARIQLISVTDAIISVEVPIRPVLVRMACEAVGAEMNELLQQLAAVAKQVNSEIQEALQCQTKSPSTSPVQSSTATTGTG